MTTNISRNSVLPPTPTHQTVNKSNNNFVLCDKLVQQLLSKLDEGTSAIMNLRSLLNLKTVELNELISQLEMIEQEINNVENGTKQIELVLKDVIRAGKDKSLDAEATLDSAIKYACSLSSSSSRTIVALYSTPKQQHTDSKMREKQILQVKMNELISLLQIDANQFFSQNNNYKNDDMKDDFEVLQRAYIDLDLAKTIASSIKSDLKQRSTFINKNAPLLQIKQLTQHVKNQLNLYQVYTRNAAIPLLYQGTQVFSILDREGDLTQASVPVPIKKKTKIPKTIIHPIIIPPSSSPLSPSPPTPLQKKQQRSGDFVLHKHKSTMIIHSHKSTTTTTTTVHNNQLLHIDIQQQQQQQQQQITNKQQSSFSRHTSSSKAKSREARISVQVTTTRPGSTLRIRSMLAKRSQVALLQQPQQQRICV